MKHNTITPIKLSLFWGLLLITTFTKAQYLEIADSLFQKHQNASAALFYEKAYYYAQTDSVKSVALLKKIYALKQEKKYNQIWKRIVKEQLSNTGVNRNEILYEAALAAFISNQPYQTLAFLETQNNSDSLPQTKYLWLKIRANNELGNWEESFRIFKQLQKQIAENQQQIVQLYINAPHLLNEYKAQQWAKFVPGAGQIYAHKIAEGVTAFVFQIGTIVWIAYELSNTAFITAYFGGLPLFQKLYQGSIRRSRFLAKQYNTKTTANFNNKLNKAIEHLIKKSINNR